MAKRRLMIVLIRRRAIATEVTLTRIMALNRLINCSIAIFNMFSLRNGVGMLNELCCNNDLTIIAVQEHWLRADDLDKFNLVHSDYIIFMLFQVCEILCCLCGYPGRQGFWWHCFFVA